MNINLEHSIKDNILNIKLKINSDSLLNLISIFLKGIIKSSIYQESTDEYKICILESEEFILDINTNKYENIIQFFIPNTLPSIENKIEYFIIIKTIKNLKDINFYKYKFKIKNTFYEKMNVSKILINKNMIKIGKNDYMDEIFLLLRKQNLDEEKNRRERIIKRLKYFDEINLKQKIDNILENKTNNCLDIFLMNENGIGLKNNCVGDYNSNGGIKIRSFNIINEDKNIVKINIPENLRKSKIEINYLQKIKKMNLKIIMISNNECKEIYKTNNECDNLIYQDIFVNIPDDLFNFECKFFSINFLAIFEFDDMETSIPVNFW